MQTEDHSTEYEVLNIKNDRLSKKTIQDGKDFEILYEVNIDKGMFGKISWCVIRNKNGKVFSTVLKRIPLEHQPVSKLNQLYLYIVTNHCLLYTSPSPRDKRQSRMPSSA